MNRFKFRAIWMLLFTNGFYVAGRRKDGTLWRFQDDLTIDEVNSISVDAKELADNAHQEVENIKAAKEIANGDL